jgi:hypothetical protein
MATTRNFSMSGTNSGHHYLPTYEMSLKSENVAFVRYCGGHVENGDCFRSIQHCPISTTFHMWVDYDVQNLSWHRKISSSLHFQNAHHNTAQIQHFPISIEIFQCRESIREIIIYPHMKCRWNRTMLNLCGIVAAILKMATARNFSMSGINLGHHYLPTYQI